MGQQQILLIVLGVIVVGIAVLLGIYMFQSQAVENKRDVVMSENMNLANMALQYYKKAKVFGGGQYTFSGWRIPSELNSTVNGNYTATVFSDSVVILGTGNEEVTNGILVQVRTVVSADNISSTIIN